MALTDALRAPLLSSQQDAEAEALGLRAKNRQLALNGTPEIVKGWESAGIAEDANALYTSAAKAYNTGDLEAGRLLEQQAQDLDARAAEVSPRVRSLRDINGFGDAMDWAAGSLGNIRSSVKPTIGGLAGAAIGAVAAPFTAGVVNPVTAGTALGTLAGYDSEADEAIASAMRDEQIRATKLMDQIINTGRAKGVGTSFLEAAVPAALGGKLVGAGAKAVAKGASAKHLVKTTGEGMAGEFLTEGTQSLAGQAAQNSLLDKPLTDFDYAQALDEAAAGAVAGGGMGVVGGGADVLHSKLQRGADKVNEIKKDPVGAAADAIADAGSVLGRGAAKFEDWMQRATSAPYRARDALVYPERYAMSEDDIKGSATSWASHVLENPNEFSEQERNDAAEFIQTGNASFYRDKLTVAHHDKRMADADGEIVDEIAERLGRKSKSSQMSASDRMYLEAEMLKPDFASQDVASVADIWRKQGVSEKLLKATSEQTDSRQREMAVAMMGWIQNGFKDVDGELFVPERFTSTYGEKAPKLIRKAAEQALLSGLIDAEAFEALENVEQMAQTQHAENSATFDAVVGNMTEAARNAYSPDDLKAFVPEMRRMAQEGTTQAEENFLLRLYGSKEKIAAAMAKFSDKGRTAPIVKTESDNESRVDEDGNVITDDNPSIEDDHEGGVEVAPGEERTTYEGLGDNHAPYNTAYDDKRNRLATRMSELANEPKKFATTVGAWTALKQQFGHDPALLRQKEDEALAASVGRKGDIGEMDDARRTSLLKAYNKTHKLIKVTESLSETTPDTVTPQQVESFREKSHNKQIDGEWVTGAGNTPENGRLYLQRKESVNTETGEATGKNENFLTSAARLIKHVWESESKQGEGRTNANTGKGALGEYQAFLRGLAALIQSDGSFTGRIGFMIDGKMRWLSMDKLRAKGNVAHNVLPETLKLMKHTVSEAGEQRTSELVEGERMNKKPTARDFEQEAGDEITSYTERNIVPSESTSSEARMDTLLAEGPQGEIYRDEQTGIQKGLGLDAEAFAVGGHGKVAGTAPVTSRKKGDVVEGLSDADRAENKRRKAEKKEPIYPKGKGDSAGSTASEKAAESKSAPLPTKATPDRLKGELPFEHDLQKKLAEERADLGARKMSDAEANFFKAAWNSLGRRSKGGLLSNAFGQIGHVFTFTKGNAGGKYLGWLGQEAGGVIGIAARTFKELSPLYKDIPAQIRYVLAHEAAHALDHTGDNAVVYSNHPTFKIERVGDKWVAHGAVAKEMLAAHLDQNNSLYDFVSKTPFNGLITDPVVAQKEMFAQAVALFYTRNTALKAALPETYKHIEALNDQTILQTPADGRGRVPGSSGQTGSAEQRSSQTNYVGQNQLRASVEARPEGRGADGAERSGVDAAVAALDAVDPTFAKNLAKENYDKLLGDTVAALIDFAHKVGEIARNWNSLPDYEEAWDTHYAMGDRAYTLFNDARKFIKDPENYNGTDFDSFFDGIEHTDEDVMAFAEALVGKQSALNADIQGRQASQGEVDAAVKHLTDTLDSTLKQTGDKKFAGDSIVLDFKKWFGDNSSGRWTERRKRNLIELALNGDVLGVAYHESLHEFFNQLGRHGAENVQELLKRVATNKIIVRQLHKLLKDHEKAIAQLSDPEEAVAYMYQFWRAGLLKIGPETQTFFEKVANWLRHVFNRVQPEVRDMKQAELLLRAFSQGAIKESATKAAVIEAMRKDVEAHDRAIEALGKGTNALVNAFGKLAFSAEAIMERTGNKHMVEIMRMANQKAGESMRDKQAYFDAVHAAKGRWMNKLQNMLTGHDADVLNIAREALNTETPTHHPEAKALAANVRKYLDEMFDYVTERGVMRWDAEAENKKWGTQGDWVPVQKRKDYFMQVWSTETLLKNKDEFIKLMLEHHTSTLNRIAQEANAEIDAHFKGGEGTLGQSAKAAVEAAHDATGRAIVGRNDVQAVTAEQIAEAIYARVINANGHIDLAESTSNLGMSPAAAAVNRRELDWIKKDVFDKFMEQDLVKILTTYTQSMVKRAEYTHSFGAGGEKIAELADKAVLQELGGDELIKQAEKRLPLLVKFWKKQKAAAAASGLEFTQPFPTLRSAGMNVHAANVASEDKAMADLRQAIKKLDPGFKAVMAIEGTLGNTISPGLRSINSTLITYQNLRLMVPGLFSQYNDLMGLVVQGGTLGDAWEAFVRSMREIRQSWKGEKIGDRKTQRAEMYGTVEATAALDALGQTFGSMYLTGGAKRMNDALFKWNGMEAFNRAVRVTATSVAERVIQGYRKNGYDANNKAEVAMFERLFGKNFDPKSIKLDADGDLDAMDPANQAAVMRWVSDAVMLPNATHRPPWASDPHYAPFWQFKQFAYTLHRVMLKNAVEQAKLGNYRPGMVLLVGYAPVMIAADAVKELLIPGDEPPWMKMGLGGMIEHGVDRAGVFGIPQMFAESVSRDYGVSLLGPSVGQVSGMISDPLARSALGSLPAGSLLRRAASD